MSNLVRNPENRFSNVVSHIYHIRFLIIIVRYGLFITFSTPSCCVSTGQAGLGQNFFTLTERENLSHVQDQFPEFLPVRSRTLLFPLIKVYCWDKIASFYQMLKLIVPKACFQIKKYWIQDFLGVKNLSA